MIIALDALLILWLQGKGDAKAPKAQPAHGPSCTHAALLAKRIDLHWRMGPHEAKQILLLPGARRQALPESARHARGKGGRAAHSPHCGFEDALRDGHSRGLQRYWCCTCGKTFSNATDTPLSGLRIKDRFAEFAGCMVDGLTIRATAKRMGIATSTASKPLGNRVATQTSAGMPLIFMVRSSK